MTGHTFHLPDLNIRGFRGFEELNVSRLGRVTLLTGKNAVGKTTVLEAIRAYAARGRANTLRSILASREETMSPTHLEEDRRSAVDWSSLFHGRHDIPPAAATIGSRAKHDQLTLRVEQLSEPQQSSLFRVLPDSIEDERPLALIATFRGRDMVVTLWPTMGGRPSPSERAWELTGSRRLTARDYRFLNEAEPPDPISCTALGPGLPENALISRFWDEVALTEHEDLVLEALRLVLGDQVEATTVIGEGTGRPRGRRPVVRLKGYRSPVPLRSLGDGAARLFGIALALANNHGGFLLIDEAENGLHHSIQLDFWRMLLRTADTYNVQVVATTHSKDCTNNFAQALEESPNIDGALVRLSSSRGALRAVEYSEEQAQVASDQGIEVR